MVNNKRSSCKSKAKKFRVNGRDKERDMDNEHMKDRELERSSKHNMEKWERSEKLDMDEWERSRDNERDQKRRPLDHCGERGERRARVTAHYCRKRDPEFERLLLTPK